MIEYVSLKDLHSFDYNPIIGQHILRYDAITKRQGWDILSYEGMEFDQYDNPAAKYLVYKDENQQVRACSRLYPTSLPYMLEENFPEYINKIDLPKDARVWEGSRFCIDKNLSTEMRAEAAKYTVTAYLELALAHEVKGIVGLMYPAYWRRIFVSNGWDIEFIGDVMKTDEGHRAQAAWLPVSPSVLQNVRSKTGITRAITNLRVTNEHTNRKVA